MTSCVRSWPLSSRVGLMAMATLLKRTETIRAARACGTVRFDRDVMSSSPLRDSKQKPTRGLTTAGSVAATELPARTRVRVGNAVTRATLLEGGLIVTERCFERTYITGVTNLDSGNFRGLAAIPLPEKCPAITRSNVVVSEAPEQRRGGDTDEPISLSL